jgi:2-dehydro-3-deoxyphosphogluconate aldolase/(4S)-4-hydroxy-2-oxoglutarate aldolase
MLDEAGEPVVEAFDDLKALLAPLPQVRLMPTGGVDFENAAAFLKAGACCLGVGSSLVEKEAVAKGDFDRIRALAEQFVRIVRQVRVG